MCAPILECIRSNARVPVILPDWHNYGWDVWRYTWGVKQWSSSFFQRLLSCSGRKDLYSGWGFFRSARGSYSGILYQPSSVSVSAKQWQHCPRWMIYHVSFFWKSNSFWLPARTHKILKSSTIAPSSARHKSHKARSSSSLSEEPPSRWCGVMACKFNRASSRNTSSFERETGKLHGGQPTWFFTPFLAL